MRDTPFYVVGNWKSNKTVAEAADWFKEFQSLWRTQPLPLQNLKLILCPPILHLTTLSSLIKLSGIPMSLGLQDISAYPSGAYTGEVSAEMVKELAQYTLVGHSERRKYFGENENQLLHKIKLAVAAGIESIYCVQDEGMEIPKEVRLVAYEPIWAIGTGKPDTPENANRVVESIKTKVKRPITVIYGGSVTPDNVKAYATMEHIGGVLPGGTSLLPSVFYHLILNARV